MGLRKERSRLRGCRKPRSTSLARHRIFSALRRGVAGAFEPLQRTSPARFRRSRPYRLERLSLFSD